MKKNTKRNTKKNTKNNTKKETKKSSTATKLPAPLCKIPPLLEKRWFLMLSAALCAVFQAPVAAAARDFPVFWFPRLIFIYDERSLFHPADTPFQ